MLYFVRARLQDAFFFYKLNTNQQYDLVQFYFIVLYSM